MKVNSYAAYEVNGELKEYSYELNELREDYVDVKVTHCGVCHTDLTVVDGKYPVPFPLVGGHEVVGIIHSVGKNVQSLKVGDRVGCHNVRSSCDNCSNCHRGFEHMCAKFDCLFNGGGGFGEYVRMQSKFVYRLPDDLPSEYAAPLMCAGVTSWASLREPGVKPGDRVAVLGIGGLGHLALKYARAFGCEVAAISTSRSKETEAKEFGAHHFIVLNEQADVAKFQDYFDYIIITATAELDYMPLTSMLRFKGTFVMSGVPGTSMTFSTVFAMIKGFRVISIVGCSRAEQREMIEFSAKHKIYPKIELLPIAQINEAFDKVKKNSARYRMVLQH